MIGSFFLLNRSLTKNFKIHRKKKHAVNKKRGKREHITIKKMNVFSISLFSTSS
jgi:hypothetical protein